MKATTVLLSAALLGATASAAKPQPASDASLGSVHFPISCGAVQQSFDRAILMLSNFAYPDTVKAFRAISEEAPDCAIAYWGIAISEMPNPLSPPFPPGNLDEGWAAIQKGKKATIQTPREGDYLAAVPARYVLERGRWDEAARLPVGDSAYPAAQAISYFARALGAARSGDLDGARSEIDRLDQAEKALSAAHNDYWAAQTLVQKQAAAAWLMFAEGKGDAAIAAMRAAADRDDSSEKTVAMENKLLPIRELLGELYLAAKRYRQALAEFEASNKAYPNRFRTLAGAAAAARAAGEMRTARHYSHALLTLTKDGDGDRPEVTEANKFLAQRR